MTNLTVFYDMNCSIKVQMIFSLILLSDPSVILLTTNVKNGYKGHNGSSEDTEEIIEKRSKYVIFELERTHPPERFIVLLISGKVNCSKK